jgi:hypothetical protein
MKEIILLFESDEIKDETIHSVIVSSHNLAGRAVYLTRLKVGCSKI